MFSSLLPANDAVSMNKLFSSSTSSIRDILSRQDVTVYLRKCSQSTSPSKCVLSFVERYLPRLIILSQWSDSTDGENKNTEPEAAASSVTAAPPTPPQARADGEDCDDSAPADNTEESDDISSCTTNASELLIIYILSGSREAIEKLVPLSISSLTKPEALMPAVAQTIQRLLLAAFESDFMKTTETIAATLTEETTEGIIQNLSMSSIVGETIIALFGSALSATSMMAPSTKTHLFTEAWIKKRFPEQFSRYLHVAIRDGARYNYFYFYKELLKRGFSHTAGPVVDIILGEDLFIPMLEVTIEACEEDAKVEVVCHQVKGLLPLSGDAMACVSAAMGLVRKSLVVPETSEMYVSTANNIAPLVGIEKYATRLVALLAEPNPCGAAIVCSKTVGLGRHSVCEVFAELISFHVYYADRIVTASKFLPCFLDLCEKHPGSDFLARLLHRCFLQAFSRPLLHGETVAQALDRDHLMKCIIESERRGDGGGGEGGLLSRIVAFANDARKKYQPLSTFSIDLLYKLSLLPYFHESGSDSSLSMIMSSFSRSELAQSRLRDMQEPITGTKFQEEGSAGCAPASHRPLINLTGQPYTANTNGVVGSPTWMDSVADVISATTIVTTTTSQVALPEVATSGGSNTAADDFCLVAAAPTAATAEELAAHDTVNLDLDAVGKEVDGLREAGSPQLRAYPSFRTTVLVFGSSDE